MKKNILPRALFLTLTIILGTLTVFAFPSERADVVSSATQKTSVATQSPSAEKTRSAQLTQEEQSRLTELTKQERTMEQQEDTLERSYRSGSITRTEYLKQKMALDAAEDAVERELDALEIKAGYDHDDYDDHDDDYDDHDDHDDDYADADSN